MNEMSSELENFDLKLNSFKYQIEGSYKFY